MKVEETTLKDWMNDVRRQRIALPRFQRYEEWEKGIIESFLTSVVKNLPTGAALAYDVRGTSPFEYRWLEGAPDNDSSNPDQLLLDGQQRLTAVWKSLNGLYSDRTFLLSFKPNGEIKVTSKKRYTKKGKEDLYPLWVDNPEECWERHKVPIRNVNPESEYSELREWCKEASEENHEEIMEQLLTVRQNITEFTLPKLILEDDTRPQNAIEVFIKLNTSYVSLSSFDIAVAKTEAATGESLHGKKDALLNECPELQDYRDPEKYILDNVSLRQDRRPTKKTKEERLDFNEIISDWDYVTAGTEDLISFLEQDRVFDSKRLPTKSVLGPMACLLEEVSTHPDRRGNQKRLLKKYLWRSFFTDRYETSTNTRVYEDYQALKARLNGSDTEVPCFDEDSHPLPSESDLKNAGWPTKKNRLGRAILAASLKMGAKNFADDDEATKRNISNREYHHLYPRAFLKEQGIDGSDANTALNCALIRWEDNRNISSKEPLRYLLERSEADDMGEDQIRRRLRSHIIDYDAMAANDYEQFLNKRASDVSEKMRVLCDGKDPLT